MAELPSSTSGRFSKVRLTVGAKLGGLISALLMASVLGLVSLSTHLFVEYNTAQIQQITYDTASNLSVQMRKTFEASTEKMRILGSMLLQGQKDVDRAQELISNDASLLGIFVHEVGRETHLKGQALSLGLKGYDVNDLQEKGLALGAVLKQGDAGAQIFLTQLPDGTAVVALSLPFVKEGDVFTHTLTALLSPDLIFKNFTELSNVTGYMVDANGTLIAHTDTARAIARENLAGVGIVRDYMSGKKSIQREYDDPVSHERFMGAFKTVGFAGLGVVAELPKAKAFEGANRVRYQSLLAAAIILFVSFMLGNYFSAKTITGPILILAEAAQRISKGDFLIALKPRAKDEIGDLALTFNQMALGLQERDKVKAVFNKFHNEAITQKLLAGEVKLGGERLNATIFFSDVRGFTALSETLQPEEVVEMLNEYMTRMVSIIHAHKGIVDKYVGDAIMALWGVPIAGPDDTAHAVRACIEMRRALSELNELRLSRGQGVLKIGMGLNRGEVIAGNIGSEQKMEYTVIGDAVNTASRIESMTKEYGTDLLVSKSVHDACEGRFLFESVKAARVKGKTSALELHRVTGYVDESGAPVIVETPYSSYASEKSDKGVHEETAPESVADLRVEVTQTGVLLYREDDDPEEIDVDQYVKRVA